MRAHAQRWILSVVALLGLAVLARPALADMSPKVIKAFKGQIIVSEGPLEPGANDKATIAAYKKQKITSVKGTPNADDVTTWTFHYTAFLKSKGLSSLAFEFYDGKKFAAEQRLEGVDPTLTVLEGDITITEDDGPTKGKKYTLKLVGQKGGKDVILASTTLSLD
jgi:hypothetical protein